jgi:glycosyltransferase involved in cell wall biosynthesis
VVLAHQKRCPRSDVIFHYGPDPRFVGGMATVLNVYRENSVGGDVVIRPTWVPKQFLRTLSLTARALWGVMQLPRARVVHVHLSERGSFVREGAILALAARRGLRTVATIHGSEFVRFSESHPRLVAWVLRHVQAVICLSVATSERVRVLAPGAKVCAIPNPAVIDDDSPPVQLTRELVVFAGEVGIRKGADILEGAWQTIAARRPDAECVLVGPPTSLEVAAQGRLSVRSSASADDIRVLLREARVVVLPSRAEAMPMILIEAQGAGRPFVATPVGAIPELAAHGGVVVPVGDIPALADAVTSLLAEPAYAADLGGRGQRHARETRSIEIVDGRLRSLYDQLSA